MTKRALERVLANRFGLSSAETDRLLRCERALARWAERECGDGSNWAIERDDVTGEPFDVYHGEGSARRYPIPDREAGALRRIAAIVANHPGVSFFHQTDPRGCMLYLYRVDNAQLKAAQAADHFGAICSLYSSIGTPVCV